MTVSPGSCWFCEKPGAVPHALIETPNKKAMDAHESCAKKFDGLVPVKT